MSFSAKRSPLEIDASLDETLIRAFLAAVPDYVFFKDCESRFIAVSDSKVRRNNCTDAAELYGKTDADFWHEGDAQWAKVDEENIISTGEPIISKIERTEWQDGRVTWTDVSKLPLRDETGQIVGTFGISKDITESQRIEAELEKARRNLVDTSRKAGMAEVATGVLHNVGNVLTSLNVSASVISASIAQSKADSLARVAALVNSHRDDLGTYMASDPKGSRIPDFLESLARHGLEERETLLKELASLQANIDHIKEIVSMQQAYATLAGALEPLDPTMLMDDALRMNAGALVRHQVALVREFHPVPKVVAEKAKVLQILVNFIRNAKYACDEGGRADKTVVLRLEHVEDRVRFAVVDNGVGIPAENMPRLFQHGFTTRAGGHGFGLHSAAVAAKEMKGKISAHSEGPGLGATFTLELPIERD